MATVGTELVSETKEVNHKTPPSFSLKRSHLSFRSNSGLFDWLSPR